MGVTLNDKSEKVYGDYGFRCLSNDMNISRWNSGGMSLLMCVNSYDDYLFR